MLDYLLDLIAKIIMKMLDIVAFTSAIIKNTWKLAFGLVLFLFIGIVIIKSGFGAFVIREIGEWITDLYYVALPTLRGAHGQLEALFNKLIR